METFRLTLTSLNKLTDFKGIYPTFRIDEALPLQQLQRS